MTKSESKNGSIFLVVASIILLAVFAIIFKDVTLYNKTNPETRILRAEKVDSKTLFFNDDSMMIEQANSNFC